MSNHFRHCPRHKRPLPCPHCAMLPATPAVAVVVEESAPASNALSTSPRAVKARQKRAEAAAAREHARQSVKLFSKEERRAEIEQQKLMERLADHFAEDFVGEREALISEIVSYDCDPPKEVLQDFSTKFLRKLNRRGEVFIQCGGTADDVAETAGRSSLAHGGVEPWFGEGRQGRVIPQGTGQHFGKRSQEQDEVLLFVDDETNTPIPVARPFPVRGSDRDYTLRQMFSKVDEDFICRACGERIEGGVRALLQVGDAVDGEEAEYKKAKGNYEQLKKAWASFREKYPVGSGLYPPGVTGDLLAAQKKPQQPRAERGPHAKMFYDLTKSRRRARVMSLKDKELTG